MPVSGFIIALLLASSMMQAMAQEAPPSAHTLGSNISLVSNYVRRGIGQTSSNPAIQGGMDYAHRGGFYAGLWGSPVSWILDKGAVDMAQYGRPTTEVDLYFGYRNRNTADYVYDLGFIRYNYLGNYTTATGSALADSAEVYAGIGNKHFSAKYSYSILNQFMTVMDAASTNYLELNAHYAIAETPYTIHAHIGRQTYTGAMTKALDATGMTPDYADFRIGIDMNIGSYVLNLSHSNTDASPYYTHAKTLGGNWAGPATTVSVTHSFR